MSRKPNIKWRESDAQRLEKEIRNFNNKVYRSRKKYNNWMHLPRPILAEDKKAMIESLKEMPRNEFNKRVNSLKRFSSVKGAEKPIKSKTGNVVSAWEKKEVEIKVATLNRKRAKERKIIENTPATTVNKPLGMKRGQMEDKRMAELRPIEFNFDKKQGGREWESFQRMLDKNLDPDAREKRFELYKANLIKGVRNEHGEEGEDIALLLEKLPAEDIVKKYYSEEQATIDFVYEPAERTRILDVMRTIWRGVADEKGIKWDDVGGGF